MAGASSGSRMLFLWVSVFISPIVGPPGASSVKRRAEGSEEKPWLNAQELLLRPGSGNLYKQEVRDPGDRERWGVGWELVGSGDTRETLRLSEGYLK